MEINVNELTKEIANSKIPLLVEFWGSWCPPCQMMAPILEEIAKEYQNKVKIVKINSDINFRASAKYKITGLPTFLLFSAGKEVARVIGAKSKKEIAKMIDGVLGDRP